MARKPKPTGTVAARHNRETERETAAREARAELVDETKTAQRKTAKFLASKPADSRNLERK